MLDWLGLGALPIGLLVFAGMALGMFLRRARHRAARSELPALAQKLGLEFRPSPHARGIGKLSGTFRGYRVFVDPDDQRRISVSFDHQPGVDLRSYEHQRRPPPGVRPYHSGCRSFDTWLRTRWASDEVADRLDAAPNLDRIVRRLRSTYQREIHELVVTPDGVGCVLHFGNPPHLPAAAVEELLPALVALARIIEPHLPGEP